MAHHPSHPTPTFHGRLVKAIGWLAVLGLTVFSLWLLHLVYFDRSWEEQMASRGSGGTHARSVQATHEPLRFHMEIPYSLETMPNPPICFTCHTPYPHREDTRTQSYLNMHGTFLACETCHVPPNDSNELFHAWFTDDTDQVTRRGFGERGVYGAHIYPANHNLVGRTTRLGKRVNDPRWDEFAQYVAAADDAGRDAMKDEAHEGLSDAALVCVDCHTTVLGALDFEFLGYTPLHARRLEHLEVVGMVEESAEFHIPDLRGVLAPISVNP